MVWEYQITTIVMLTRCVEDGKVRTTPLPTESLSLLHVVINCFAFVHTYVSGIYMHVIMNIHEKMYEINHHFCACVHVCIHYVGTLLYFYLHVKTSA